MLFDTHAHIDQPDFDEDRAEVIARAADAGVQTIIAVGTTADTSVVCADLAEQYPGVYAAVGIQPNYVHEAQAEDWGRICALLERPKVVALGETGLDRYWDYAPFHLQQDYFDRHLRLSQERDLPFIVHMRDREEVDDCEEEDGSVSEDETTCGEEILKMLREAHSRGPLSGVMHSFAGDAAMAAECVELGLHISFAGMVTFKKSDDLRACAATVPSSRLLIETDSPYLSPHPLRKIRRNEPAHLVHTAKCLAEVRGESLELFSQQTTKNARELFRL